MFSLRKLFWLVFPTTVTLLALVIILGARQYSLSGKYSSIIDKNEKALFHFITVREAVTEALITGDHSTFTSLIPTIEQLNSTFSKMQESTAIPSDLQLNLLGQIDLPGMVIGMRRLAAGDGGDEEKLNIQEEMRNIGKYLVQYDRVLASHARSRIHSLQLIIIGSMGIIISILSFALILLYKNSILPALNITRQLNEATDVPATISSEVSSSSETLELIEAIENQLRAVENVSGALSDEDSAQYSLFVEHVNGSTNQLNGLINYIQLLADTDEHLYSPEQRELLKKIVDTSKEIEESWQQF